MHKHQTQQKTTEQTQDSKQSPSSQAQNSQQTPLWAKSKPVQRQSLTVNQPNDPYEREADQVANQVMNTNSLTLQRKSSDNTGGQTAPSSVHSTISQSGQSLDNSTQQFMESRFNIDFSGVRIHTDSQANQSAADVNAAAYTVGNHIVFGGGHYQPQSSEGKRLLAHELAHTIQQGVSKPSVQRVIEMRDVGRGENSGFARLPELIDRLNAITGGIDIVLMPDNRLDYLLRPNGELSDFDAQMMGFVDQEQVIPLRLTNRHGLLRDAAGDFTRPVVGDDWVTGYVDIDDLLASDNLGLQFILVHFIRERSETNNYARRIGSPSIRFAQNEFNRAHRRGFDSELRLLRDYFDDPTIQFLRDRPALVFRIYRNDRGDLIRARLRQGRGDERGIQAFSIEVRRRDGTTMTAEAYRDFLEQERNAAQVQAERLGGADEHREGGRGIPAP